MQRAILEVNNVSKRFNSRPELSFRYGLSDILTDAFGLRAKPGLRKGEFWALRDVSFTLKQGEVLGVVGHNGAGKSTLVNLVAGLIRPTTGSIRLNANKIVLIDNNAGLNMSSTGRENILTLLALHGFNHNTVRSKVSQVIEFAELHNFIDAPVGTYSLGMKLRLGFSIYTCLNPDVFIIDEAISGGDIRFRRKFQSYLRSYLDNGGSILFCSHEIFYIQSLCENTLLLDSGRLIKFGPTAEVIKSFEDIMSNDHKLQQIPATNEDKDIHYDQSSSPPLGHGMASENPANHQLDGIQPNPVDQLNTNKIQSISIESLDHGPLLPGKPAVLKISCFSVENVKELLFGIEIYRDSELPITIIIHGLGEQRFQLMRGKNVFICNITALPLLPGQYEVRTVLTDESTASIVMWNGYEDPPYIIDVANPNDKEFNVLANRKASFYIETQWDKIV